VRGTGEIVDPIPPFPPLWCCIVLPTFRIDTRRAYAALDNAITREGASEVEPMVDVNSVIKALRTRVSLGGSNEMRLNSFERTLGENAASFLSIRSMLLASDAILAGLSGSGSAVFGIYAERAAAEAAALDVQQRISAARTLVAEIL
jgi:4-diphosphocytidyl-2C-methyl-D-erythritol kinase